MRLYKLDAEGVKLFSNLKTDNLSLFVASQDDAELRSVFMDTLSKKKKAQMVWVEEKNNDSVSAFIVYFGDSDHIDAFLSGPFHKEADKYTVNWIAIEPQKFRDSMRALKGYKCNEVELARFFPEYTSVASSSQSSGQARRNALKTPSTLSAKKKRTKKKSRSEHESERGPQGDETSDKLVKEKVASASLLALEEGQTGVSPDDGVDAGVSANVEGEKKAQPVVPLEKPRVAPKPTERGETKKVTFAATAGVTLHGGAGKRGDAGTGVARGASHGSKQQEREPLLDRGETSKSACCLLL